MCIRDSALDREGMFTEGAVATSFVLARLEGENGPYTAFTTREQTSPITGETAIQPSADEGGTYTVIDAEEGLYEYELGVELDAVEATATHTIAAWATRDFEGARYVDNEVFHFRPDGDDVTARRQIVETEACNSCHNPLKIHGGARREVDLCITCHTAGVDDPDTGNTVDMAVMIHKIHRGHDLPSVVAGEPYQIVGFQQSVHDYSTVAFPQPIQHCQTCHTGPDAEVWRSAPTRTACGSCHDRTSFVSPAPAGWTMHTGGAQASDANCTVCHDDFAGIDDAHLTQYPVSYTHLTLPTKRIV